MAGQKKKKETKERRADKCESRAGTCVRVLMKPRGRWFRGHEKERGRERGREREGLLPKKSRRG